MEVLSLPMYPELSPIDIDAIVRRCTHFRIEIRPIYLILLLYIIMTPKNIIILGTGGNCIDILDTI